MLLLLQAGESPQPRPRPLSEPPPLPACRRRCSKNGVYIRLSWALHLMICFTMYLLLLLLLLLLLHKETYHGLRRHGRAPAHGLGVCLALQETIGDWHQETYKKLIQTEAERQTDRERERDRDCSTKRRQ